METNNVIWFALLLLVSMWAFFESFLAYINKSKASMPLLVIGWIATVSAMLSAPFVFLWVVLIVFVPIGIFCFAKANKYRKKDIVEKEQRCYVWIFAFMLVVVSTLPAFLFAKSISENRDGWFWKALPFLSGAIMGIFCCSSAKEYCDNKNVGRLWFVPAIAVTVVVALIYQNSCTLLGTLALIVFCFLLPFVDVYLEINAREKIRKQASENDDIARKNSMVSRLNKLENRKNAMLLWLLETGLCILTLTIALNYLFSL